MLTQLSHRCAVWNTVNTISNVLLGLISFIPCNIHAVHNALRAGINAYREESEELAIYWLKSSRSHKEDYICVLTDLGLDDELLNRRVQCRCLTLLPALDRIVNNWEVKKYFLEELPEQATQEKTKSLHKNELYNHSCNKLHDKSFRAQLALLLWNQFLGSFVASFRVKGH